MIDLRQTQQYCSFMKKRGWIAEKLLPENKTNHVIYAYLRRIPVFPLYVMKVQRFNEILDFSMVKKLVRKYHVILVTLEPGLNFSSSDKVIHKIMQNNGYRKTDMPLLPSRTIQLDLEQSTNELFYKIKSRARTYIRKAAKNLKVKIINFENKRLLTEYYEFWKKDGKGFVLTREDYLKLFASFLDKAFIVAVYKKGVLLSGILILTVDLCAYYHSSVTSLSGRKSLAGYLAVWNSIIEAKRRKCKLFDFEGIYDDRYPKLIKWKGFSKFKSRFGGKEILYPLAYIKLFNPFF